MTALDAAEPLADVADADAETGVGEPRRLVRAGATIVVIVPIIAAATRAIRNDWFPIGDNALLFIRTRDVLTEDHPYLGSWTSASLSVGENMNNPGAMYDWLISPFAHLMPPGPAAAIGVATVNIAMICIISATAHRIGGWSLQRWALLFAALLAWTMGSEMLFDIWQANALIFPFFALLLLSVGIAAGDDTLLPWAAVVASLLLQTHISYAYVFVFVVAAVLGFRIWQRHAISGRLEARPRGERRCTDTAVVAVAVGAVLRSGQGQPVPAARQRRGGDFSLGPWV